MADATDIQVENYKGAATLAHRALIASYVCALALTALIANPPKDATAEFTVPFIGVPTSFATALNSILLLYSMFGIVMAAAFIQCGRVYRSLTDSTIKEALALYPSAMYLPVFLSLIVNFGPIVLLLNAFRPIDAWFMENLFVSLVASAGHIVTMWMLISWHERRKAEAAAGSQVE